MNRLQDMQDFLARCQERAAAEEREHEAKLALLPPDTCRRCLGEKFISDGFGRFTCPECNAPLRTAQGIPQPFAAVRFSDFELTSKAHEHALNLARALAAGGTRDLVLVGNTGIGKSFLACCALNEGVNSKPSRTARFIRTTSLLSGMMPGRNDSGELDASCQRVGLLALDDLGSEGATDFSRRTITELLEARTDRGLRTIITTNVSLEKIAEMHDARLASRLAGRADFVKLDGVDQRVARRRP